MKHAIFTNWRTSLMGLGAAICYAVVPLIMSGTVDPKALATAAFIAGWGFVSKDAAVSGLGIPDAQKALSIGKRFLNVWKAIRGKNLVEAVPLIAAAADIKPLTEEEKK